METENAEKKEKQDRRKTMPHLYKKGQSGNPAGKPPGTLSLTAAIKKRLARLEPKERRIVLEVLADKIVQGALGEDRSPGFMKKLIWNYLDGLPKQPIEHSGEVDLPIKVIKVEKYDDSGTKG